MALLMTFLIGIAAGSRTMTAPAAVAWGAWLGWIDLSATWASFMGTGWAVLILSALALAEFVTDQLPSTPSRKVPVQFGGRIVSGAFCGAALGALTGGAVLGLILGAAGAVAGTLGGAQVRGMMAAAFGSDRPAAFIEDAAAVVLALIAVTVAG